MDFFRLALATNRTAVIPCVSRARIEPCSGNFSISLSHIFDLAYTVRKSRPKKNLRLIEWDRFSSKKDEKRQDNRLCHLRPRDMVEEEQLWRDIRIRNYTTVGSVRKGRSRFKDYETCVRSIRTVRRMNKQPGDAITMYYPWHNEVLSKEKRYRLSHINQKIELRYHPSLYQMASRILNESNIDNRYIVFNWRSETVPVEHIEQCANTLVNNSRIWADRMNFNRSQLILMSDISLSRSTVSLLWRNMNASQQHIRQHLPNTEALLRNNFVKLETNSYVRSILSHSPMYADPVFFSIWDEIIAESATMFVTCTEDDEHVCHHCFRTRSTFVEMIVDDRTHHRLPSSTVWDYKKGNEKLLRRDSGTDVTRLFEMFSYITLLFLFMCINCRRSVTVISPYRATTW